MELIKTLERFTNNDKNDKNDYPDIKVDIFGQTLFYLIYLILSFTAQNGHLIFLKSIQIPS